MRGVLTWPYRAGVALRNAAFELGLLASRRLPGFTISVGNLAAGGTGKTPMTLAIADWLARERPDLKIAILTRGYRSGLPHGESMVLVKGQVALAPKACDSRHVFADEARLQSVRLPGVPVVVGANRWRAAARFMQEYPPAIATQSAARLWILDDGFQHRWVARDLDIVLIDGDRPLDPLVIPVGRMREVPAALRRAHAVLWMRPPEARGNQERVLSQLASLGLRERAFLVPTILESPWKVGSPRDEEAQLSRNARLLVVCAIAQPSRFIADLSRQGWLAGSQLLERDHGRFDRQQIIDQLDGHQAIATTEKDYWREPQLFESLGFPVWVFPVRPDVPSGFWDFLATRLSDK